MVDLENRIARLELRAEQIVIHLQNLQRTAPEAKRAGSDLYTILQELAELKAERERRKALIELEDAA